MVGARSIVSSQLSENFQAYQAVGLMSADLYLRGLIPEKKKSGDNAKALVGSKQSTYRQLYLGSFLGSPAFPSYPNSHHS